MAHEPNHIFTGEAYGKNSAEIIESVTKQATSFFGHSNFLVLNISSTTYEQAIFGDIISYYAEFTIKEIR